MFPASFGPDFLKNLEPIPEKQAVIITLKGFGFIDADEPLKLGDFADLKPLDGFLVAYQDRFGQFSDPPTNLDLAGMKPVDESVLIVYQAFCGIFKLGEEIFLSKEIKRGDRMVSLARQALIVYKLSYDFIPIQDNPTDDCEKIIAELRAEIKQLKNENTSLRQQLSEIPALRLQIDRLKDILIARDNEILELKARIQQMIDATKRTPEDFATAVSDTVDKLQTKLSNMPNNISDFVVREFSLEAKIYVDVNEEGQIDYRFIRPGDNVAPEKVSNLTLTLAPVPKPESSPPPEPTPGLRAAPAPAAQASAPAPGQEIPIEQIVGEGGELRERMSRNNINTVADFLQVATRARTLAAFSAMLEIDRQRLGNWVMQAQLMTLGGISAVMAQALIDIGIPSLQILADAEAEALLKQYNTRAADLSLSPATIEDVQRWIATAQSFVNR
jgi:hypothetical protein